MQGTVIRLLPALAVLFPPICPSLHAEEPPGADARRAGEAFGVKLLRPDSLAGWSYGDPPYVGWTIAAGRLGGTGGASPLRSGFSFGDFELRFRWSVAEKTAWKILFPDAPSGQGLELILREGPGCGGLRDGNRVLAAGGELAPLAPVDGRMHTAAIRRTGGKLSLAVDDRVMAESAVDPARRFGLGLAVAGNQALLEDLRVEEPRGTSIFNGRDLEGWRTAGDPSAWGAENGELVLRKPGGNYLRTKRQYANFTLSLEYRIDKGGNSGIGIRTPPSGWPSGDGMELQIWDLPYGDPLDKHAAMAIYGNVPPLARADRSGQWNRVVIKADGPMISAWMNGEFVQHCDTAEHPELKHRHPTGWIGIQEHGAKMQVRNLYVLEAPADMPPASLRRPTLDPVAVVLDRLMNPERLSRARDLDAQTRAVTASVSGDRPDGQVLADLDDGHPGVLVRIARTTDEGHLAFYVDGQAKPRLECRAGELAGRLPHLCDDLHPLLTCLPYAKRLKIVLRGARSGRYRFDYVAFPSIPGVLPTFEPGPKTDRWDEWGAPRGWLPACVYRHNQFGWGGHREFDPLPRMQSPEKVIPPGKSERLLQLDGAGIVHWVKLRADKRVLDNHDLWLEARVDGRSQPAIAAPARFWFPGLAGQGNWPSFVMVDRGGPTSVLAMPYGNGLSIAAVNRGNRPTPPVGLTVSCEPAGDADRDDVLHRMRLRGVFQAAGEGGPELLRLAGRGRWIGLVCEQESDSPPAIDSLDVDGRPAEGWRSLDAGLLLGQGGDFRTSLSGRHRGLWWRYLLLEPVDFRQSLVLKCSSFPAAARLGLWYQPQ